MVSMKSKEEFKILLLYPNLSMLLSPPLSIPIFAALMKNAGYQVDLFDVTPYIGEGASLAVEGTFVGDEMNTTRADENCNIEENFNFQSKSIDALMQEIGQGRVIDFEEGFGIKSKYNLFDDFKKKVEKFQPDLIISSTVEDTFLQLVKLMSLIEGKNIPSLHGGVFITASPELALTYPNIDLVGIGEGEQIVLDVADRIRRGLTCEDIPGVWIKKDSGEIIKNSRGPLFDFTSVIPDFSLFEDEVFYRPMGGRFFKSVQIESYRGCPYTCAYCNSPMQNTLAKEAGIGNFTRRSSIERVRDYIAAVVEQVQPTFIRFVDDSFLARPKKEMEEFLKMYEEFKIPFWFNTRPENVTSEILQRLKEVNCYRMSFGIECGNEEFRAKKLLRYLKNIKIVEKFEIIANGGIAFSVNNVIGFPGETRELIFETIELNRQIPAYDALTVGIFAPYHGTVLRKESVEAGYLDEDRIIYDLHNSCLNMPQLSKQELSGLLRTFPLYVHFEKSLWPIIKQAEQFDKKGNEIFYSLSERYQKEAFKYNQDEKMEEYQKQKAAGSVSCTSDPMDSIRIPFP